MRVPAVIAGDVGPPAVAASDIEIVWQHGLPSADAAELRDAAMLDDEDMGHSAALAGPTWRRDSTVTAAVHTRLRRRGIPSAPRGQLAAVLTVASLGDSVGAVDLVVAPAFRSMGVATSVVETLVRDAGRLREFERVLMCAYGSHPAALRLAERFAAEPAGCRIHLVLPSRSDFDRSRGARAVGSGAETVRVIERQNCSPADEWTAFGGTVRDRTQLEVTDQGGQVIGYVEVSRTDDVGCLHDVRGPDGIILTAEAFARTVCHAVRHLTDDDGAAVVRTSVTSVHGMEFDGFRAAAFHRDRTDLLFCGAPWSVRHPPRHATW